MSSISTIVRLGAIKFAPKKKDEPAHVVLEYSLAGADLSEVLLKIPEMQGGACNIVLTAGRAGTWRGVGHVRAATLKPPDKQANVTVTGHLAVFEEIEKLQALARLRLAVSELDLDLVTLKVERQLPNLPLEGDPVAAAARNFQKGMQEVADRTGLSVSVEVEGQKLSVAKPRRRRQRGKK